MLLLVLIPGIGVEVNGAKRWLGVGFSQFQPSEFLKPCFIVTVAWLVSDEADYITGTTLYVDGGMTLYPGFSDNG